MLFSSLGHALQPLSLGRAEPFLPPAVTLSLGKICVLVAAS